MNKLRAVIYNRVSTDELVQLDALQVQTQESIECVDRMGWVLVDKYIDEGKSGTATKKRDEYKRLFNDLSTNNFDIVVIKSQDRLMRNTKDWYIFIDQLVSHNKKLFIYMENKFYTPDDALITGIKAILAEEFSRDMSKKQNNAHRRRQKYGTNAIITSSTWGYDKVGKEVVINEKEAEVIRTIFNLCLQGYGSRSISKELANRNILSRSGRQFAEVTVRKIIRNPLFCGTVVMNKTHVDFETKKLIRNPPNEWIYHENLVPAIISKDTWEKANKLMDNRSTIVKSDEFSEKRIGLNLGKYDLSSKIICGECNSVFWRKYRNTKSGQVVDWYCSEYIKSGRKIPKPNDKRGLNLKKIENKLGCDNRHIKDIDIMNILEVLSKQIFGDQKEKILSHAYNILKEVLGGNNVLEEKNILVEEKEKYLFQKNALLDKLLDGTITDSDYKFKSNNIDDKLKNVEQKLIDIEEAFNVANNVNLRIQDIANALNNQSLDTKAQTYKLISHIDKIIVYENSLDIYLDFLQNIKVIERRTEDKKYQYVDSGFYSIPHTDTYHKNGTYREVLVNIYV